MSHPDEGSEGQLHLEHLAQAVGGMGGRRGCVFIRAVIDLCYAQIDLTSPPLTMVNEPSKSKYNLSVKNF